MKSVIRITCLGMIGLLIVTHGNLCEEVCSAMEHVVGSQDHLTALSMVTDDDMDEQAKINSLIDLSF